MPGSAGGGGPCLASAARQCLLDFRRPSASRSQCVRALTPRACAALLQRRFILPATYLLDKPYVFTATARNNKGSSQPSDPAFPYTTCAVGVAGACCSCCGGCHRASEGPVAACA